MTRWLSVGSLLASLVVVACSGSTESDGGGVGGGSSVVSEGPVAKDQFVQKRAEAVCSNSGPCCQEYEYPHDAAKCVAAVKAELEKELASKMADPAVTYDPVKAGVCIAWVKKVVSECTPSDEDTAAMASACKVVWRGTKAQGSICSSDQQCAGAETGDAVCSPTFDTYYCRPAGKATHGAKGEACAATCGAAVLSSPDNCYTFGGAVGKRCWIEDGLYCDSETYTCVELTADGQPCKPTDICVAPDWCKAGTCSPKSQVGGECGWPNLIAACVEEAWCDEGASKCVAKFGEGSGCTTDQQCTTTECGNGTCVRPNLIANEETCGS